MTTVTDGAALPARDTAAAGWIDVCPLKALDAERGVVALVGASQVAVFRVPGAGLFALDNRDPASGANVVARGLVGSAGSALYVASPMYKHRFDLTTGRCLDDDTLRVRVWSARERDGRVEIGTPRPTGPG